MVWRLYDFRWPNPHPKVKIESVDFASSLTHCAPFLLAVTAEAPGSQDPSRSTEVESLYRKMLTDALNRHPSDAVEMEGAASCLADVLLSLHRYAEAEAAFEPVLTPDFMRQPQGAALLRKRADVSARAGDLQRAADDLKRVVEFEPTDHRNYDYLATLLAVIGDEEGYRRLCQQMLARFATTRDPSTAASLAQSCLILPTSGVDLAVVGELAQPADLQRSEPWPKVRAGLAGYRLGRFDGAEDLCRKALLSKDAPHRDVQAYAVLSMALYKLGRTEEARSALSQGIEIARTKLPELERGTAWRNVQIARVLIKEAVALLDDDKLKKDFESLSKLSESNGGGLEPLQSRAKAP